MHGIDIAAAPPVEFILDHVEKAAMQPLNKCQGFEIGRPNPGTSPIILRQYSLSRDYRSAHLDNILNVTDRTGIVTSFSSKSELALNLSRADAL